MTAAYVPMRVPGVEGEVLLPADTLFIPVTPELLDETSGEWSRPVQFKLGRAENGLVDMQIRTVPVVGGPQNPIQVRVRDDEPAD